MVVLIVIYFTKYYVVEMILINHCAITIKPNYHIMQEVNLQYVLGVFVYLLICFNVQDPTVTCCSSDTVLPFKFNLKYFFPLFLEAFMHTTHCTGRRQIQPNAVGHRYIESL